jgi:deazaflavin-dependent oxidoreductase (nitroreductase family)
MKTPPNAIMVKRYRAGMGKVVGRMMLLLTTTGRKSGNPHTVCVQYEMMDGKYYIGAGFGEKCDWYKNLKVNPRVTIEVGSRKFNGTAEVLAGEEKIADFMTYRLKKSPLMVGLILKMDGCSFRPDRAELLEYSRRIGVAVVTPNP